MADVAAETQSTTHCGWYHVQLVLPSNVYTVVTTDSTRRRVPLLST